MTSGLVGLLWLLQAAVPQQQDASKQDSLRILRDSIVNNIRQSRKEKID